jgi:DNA polymerase I
MKIVQTEHISSHMGEMEKQWVYNGLDCCVTHEISSILQEQLDDVTRETYNLRFALQAPVLEMNLRGVLVDLTERDRLIIDYEKRIKRLSGQLDVILEVGIGTTCKWSSPKQLMELFYGVLCIPPIRRRGASGEMVPTVNRGALEKLTNYFVAQPIVNHILILREIQKKIGVLKTRIDADNRMRTSFNIAGTETGRFSSSMADLETGTNLQNIEEGLRRIFIADPGMKLGNIDLEQAESRVVGAICWNLFGDGAYLDACESGDLHTEVARGIMPSLPWTGDRHKDRDIAERPHYRQHSLRYMAKRLGHGSNYMGQPATMAFHSQMPVRVIKDFQSAYFTKFNAIQRWHQWVEDELKMKGQLTTMLGMRRWFFGRRNDQSTLREAVAFEPQSVSVEILNRIMLNVWRANKVQLLLQVHDSLLFQYPEKDEAIVIPEMIKLFEYPVRLRGDRTLMIPAEVKTGYNWAPKTNENPQGLAKWKMAVGDRG